MKKTILITFILFFLSQISFSQNAIIKLKFEEAEEAYNNNDFELAVIKLKEVEALYKSTSPKTLYLLVLSQSKIIEANPYMDYNLIDNTKKLSLKYLKDYEDLENNEDKYKDVYKVSEKLKKYPATKEEFDLIQKKAEDEKAEKLRIRRIEEARIEKENQIEREKIEKINEDKRQEVLRNVGFGAFRIGMAFPLSADSKDIISYSTWFNSVPYAAPFQKGKFGLKKGFSFGFTGIGSLKKLNNKLPKKMGLGLAWDFNQTILSYNWKELAKGSSVNSGLFNDAKYGKFGITSLGLGLSVTFRPTENAYLDFYFRPDLNFIYGGAYSVSTTLKDGNRYEIETKREKMKIKMGPTFGLNYRYRKLFVGFDFRLGLVDDTNFMENYYIYNSNTYTSYKDAYEVTTNGLVLNYFGITLGVVFGDKSDKSKSTTSKTSTYNGGMFLGK